MENHLAAGAGWAVAVTVAYLIGLAAVAVVAVRRRRAFAADLAVLCLVAVAAGVVSIVRLDGPVNYYLLSWITVLPVAALTAAVLALAPGGVPAAPAGGGRPPRPGRGPVGVRADPLAAATLGVAVVLSGWVAVVHGTTQDWNRAASANIAGQTALVRRALGPSAGGLVRLHVVSASAWPDAAGVGLALERRGAHIEVDPDWVFLFGDAFAPDAGARRRGGPAARPGAELWFAEPHELPAVTPLAGVVDLGGGTGTHVLARRDG